MKSFAVIGGKLALICAIAATALGFVNNLTEPRIREFKAKQLEEALSAVVVKGRAGEEMPVEGVPGVLSYYPIQEGSGTLGYILKLIGAGYGGDMVLLASYDTKGVIQAVRLMENQETPGLGKEAEKGHYMEKFIGTGGNNPIPVRKSQLTQEQADSITGASITFIGIAKALETGAVFLETLED